MKYKIDDNEYNVVLIKKNNKYTYIRIDDELNIVVTKKNIKNEQEIIDILNKNKNKILKMINSKSKIIKKNNEFYLLGKKYDIIILSTINKVEIIDDKIYVNSIKKLDKWLSNEIKRLYSERLNYIYSKFDEKIPYPSLKFRNMKTRWGVCNKKNITITLNTNLIKYELCCLDYVIIHELSHFVEFNHSKNFWNIVSKYCKDYKLIKKKLEE